MSNTSPKIAVLSALPQEIEEIVTGMDGIKQCKLSPSNLEFKFTTGMLAGKPVVLGLTGMGKVNAAATTQKLISEMNIKTFIFTGVAGGLNPTLNIGDVVYGTSAVQHDYGFLLDKLVARRPGYLPDLGLGQLDDEISFPLSASLGDKSLAMSQILGNLKLGTVQNDHQPYNPKLHFGAIATGDQFIANEIKKIELHKQFNADAVEMEGAAVAQVCFNHSVPCIIIRAISDTAGAHAPKDFPSFMKAVAKNNALIVNRMLVAKELEAHWNKILKE